MAFDAFVAAWNLERWLNYPTDALSGGWSKFVGLALFTNMTADVKLYADSTRQLDDELIGTFLSHLRDGTHARAAVLWELDCDRVTVDGVTFGRLYDLGDRVDADPWVLAKCQQEGDCNF